MKIKNGSINPGYWVIIWTIASALGGDIKLAVCIFLASFGMYVLTRGYYDV